MWELTAIVGGFALMSAGVIVLARRSTAQWERETREARRRRRGRRSSPAGGVAGARPPAVPVKTVAGGAEAGRSRTGRSRMGRVVPGRGRRGHPDEQPHPVRRVAHRRHRRRSPDEPAGPTS